MNAQGIDTDAQTIEPILRDLVRQHGKPKVYAALAELMPTAKWADWQRVGNILKKIKSK